MTWRDNSPVEYNKDLGTWISKRVSKKIKEAPSGTIKKLKKTRAKNIIRKTILEKTKRRLKKKKKRNQSEWRLSTKLGKFSRAAVKRMTQKLKPNSKSFVPKKNKLTRKKTSFKDKVKELKFGKKPKTGKKPKKATKSKLNAYSSSWTPSKSRKYKKTEKPLGFKLEPKKKTRKSRKGMVYLKDDPIRMNTSLKNNDAFQSVFGYGYVDGNGNYIPYGNKTSLFGLANNLNIRDLNNLRLTGWKTFKTLDPRSLNPRVQRYFRTFYNNSLGPGFAIPFTSRIDAERAKIKEKNPNISNKELKLIRKSLYASQNPDNYGVDDWEHHVAMSTIKNDNSHLTQQYVPQAHDFYNKLKKINKKIRKIKNKLKRLKYAQGMRMKKRLLNKSKKVNRNDVRFDKEISIYMNKLNSLLSKRKVLKDEAKHNIEIVTKKSRKFEPYLKNRYYEMREIPYQDRTQEQRDEKDRLLKQMIQRNISLPSTDSLSSFDGYGESIYNPHIMQKRYTDRKSNNGDIAMCSRKNSLAPRYRHMGYSEKTANRSKYFSRIAQQKAIEASKMAKIYSEQAENAALSAVLHNPPNPPQGDVLGVSSIPPMPPNPPPGDLW
tara:strand:- start:220 stop:2025 length:1806 start_codon:yes stop_codon:yes gene_type:complete